MVIYAGVRGHLDNVDLRDVTRFEQQLLSEVREKGGEILSTLRSEKEISDATEEKLKGFMDSFTKTFA